MKGDIRKRPGDDMVHIRCGKGGFNPDSKRVAVKRPQYLRCDAKLAVYRGVRLLHLNCVSS